MKRNLEGWRTWWSKLDRAERQAVRAWLAQNPPPSQWLEDAIAYAFTEMSFAPRGAS